MHGTMLQKIKSDQLVITFILIVVLLFFTSLYINVLLGLSVLVFYGLGCFLCMTLLDHKSKLNEFLAKVREKLGSEDYYGESEKDTGDCDVCGVKCNRHRLFTGLTKDPWKLIGLVDKNLDAAVDSFYSQIINSFVNSWFSPLTNDEDFIYCLKENLREATCQMVIKVKKLNAPMLITEKMLPLVFDHYETLTKMMQVDNIPINKLAATFVQNEFSVHPAVFNRQTEINYLRSIAKYLIPKLFSNENFNSTIFFNLIQELIACWVLLPLMDVLSDPNLINLLVIVATDPSKDLNAERRRMKIPLYTENVMFLENFVRRSGDSTFTVPDIKIENDILKDQGKLYSFMQFLKKEGAVELLRFYLDVEHLNTELHEPNLEPQKVDTLLQQTDKLLATYQKLSDTKFESLSDAFEDARNRLQGKWRNAFYQTSNYFELVYGSREIKKLPDNINLDTNQPSIQKLSTKIKGAMKMTAVDGAPLEEIPTVWDALADTQTDSRNIYSSVTSKLRKEKGQSLDAFMQTFMHSVEQNPDVGEDVMYMNNDEGMNRPSPPDNNVVFGNLFELKRTSMNVQLTKITPNNDIKGPSQCLIYILVKIINAPLILTRFVMSMCSVSQKTVDALICTGLFKLIKFGLKERRLAFLIRLLEEHLFIDDTPDPDKVELQRRQIEARRRLEGLRKGLGNVFDVLQSPVLNKHIMYCLFDLIIGDLYPDLGAVEEIRRGI